MPGHRTIDIRALHCPQCGAPAQVTPGEDMYLCRFCQTSFLIERPMAPPPPVPPIAPPANPYAARVNTPFPTPQRVIDLSPPRRSGGGGAIIFAIITLVAVGVGIFAAVVPKSGMFGGWSGKEPLVCSGNDWITVDHVQAHFSSGVAIDASGNCYVTCKDCSITAPTIVKARENANVHFDHGSAEGSTTFDEVTQNASVSNDHTKISGKKNEPAFGDHPDMQEWPSSGPYVCSGSNHVFKNVKIKVSSGAAIVGSVNCSVKLSNCTIEGPVGLLLNDNASVELDDCDVHATDAVIARANGEVIIEGGTFVGTDHAAKLEDNASLHAHGAKVEGSKSYSGNAEVEIE